jgi:hypothetical protein
MWRSSRKAAKSFGICGRPLFLPIVTALVTPLFFACFLACFLACAERPRPGPAETGTFERTIVVLGARGRPAAVHRYRVSVEQRTAEVELRRAVAAGKPDRATLKDPGCAYSGLWIFSEPHWSGSDLCVFGALQRPAGSALSLLSLKWTGGTMSFITGADSSGWSWFSPSASCGHVPPNTFEPAASTCVRDADRIVEGQ